MPDEWPTTHGLDSSLWVATARISSDISAT
jgi:hypothetical protein